MRTTRVRLSKKNYKILISTWEGDVVCWESAWKEESGGKKISKREGRKDKKQVLLSTAVHQGLKNRCFVQIMSFYLH